MRKALRRYSYINGQMVTMYDVQAGKSYVPHYDCQGTVQCLTDETGAVTDRFAADALGNVVKRTGNSINKNWYIGASGYYTPSAGPTYVRARHLQPSLGRWLSPDPVRTERNPYVYVENNPAGLIDPSGRISITPTLKPLWVDQHNSRCGKLRAFYNYRLDRPAPCTGWMVQMVFAYDVRYPCVETRKPYCSPTRGFLFDMGFRTNDVLYFEAWRVKEGDRDWDNQVVGAENYTDQAHFAGEPGTRGTFLQHGAVRFFCQADIGDLTQSPGWIPPGSFDLAPRLWTTLVTPKWWSKAQVNSERAASRDANSFWNCCPDNDYNSVSITPGR